MNRRMSEGGPIGLPSCSCGLTLVLKWDQRLLAKESPTNLYMKVDSLCECLMLPASRLTSPVNWV